MASKDEKGSWTQSEEFVAGHGRELGMRARHCEIAESEDAVLLQEPAVAYSRHFAHEMGLLSSRNEVSWEQ